MDGGGRSSRLTANRTAGTQRGLVWLDEELSSTGEQATSRRLRVRRHRDRRREVGAHGAPRGNEHSARVGCRAVATLQGQRGLAPLAQASSMPAGTLSQQLRELGIHEKRVLPNARSMPATVGRLEPLPGIQVTVQGQPGHRKQLFGGSSVPSTGSFNKKARDPVLDRGVVTRGREIAAQIAEADKHIEGSTAAKRAAAEAAKHRLMAELKANQELEMVVLNIRLGLQEDKPWGDHAFAPVVHAAPAYEARRQTKNFEPDVERAANLVIRKAFGGADDTDGAANGHGTDRQACAPVEDEQFTAAFQQMELALAAWPSLPADGHDPLKVDRRVSDRLIDATPSTTNFRVVWWRVIEALGYIPHSDEANRVVPVTIYRRRCTIGRMGNAVPPFWQETEPPANGDTTNTGVEKLVLQCHVTMSVGEAHAKVIEANLGN